MHSQTTKAITVLLVACTLGLVAYTATASYTHWQAEAPYRAAAARERRISSLWSRIHVAQRNLESHGACFPNHKGLQCRWIDLSAWRGDTTAFRAVEEFTLLQELKPMDGHLLEIRLGSTVNDSYVPILTELSTLAVLDTGDSQLTTAARQQLATALPELKFQSVNAIFQNDAPH